MEWYRDLKALGFWRWLYCGRIYRAVSKVSHRFGFHHMKLLHPIGNTYHWKCDWCGMTSTTLHMDSQRHGLTPTDWERYENAAARNHQQQAMRGRP